MKYFKWFYVVLFLISVVVVGHDTYKLETTNFAKYKTLSYSTFLSVNAYSKTPIKYDNSVTVCYDNSDTWILARSCNKIVIDTVTVTHDSDVNKFNRVPDKRDSILVNYYTYPDRTYPTRGSTEAEAVGFLLVFLILLQTIKEWTRKYE